MDEYRSGLMPEDKVTVVNELKKAQHRFCGDGVNDARSCRADVGAAMVMGTDAALNPRTSCDARRDRALAKGGLEQQKDDTCVRRTGFHPRMQGSVLALAGRSSPVWLAVFADVGVCLITVVWAARLLASKRRKRGCNPYVLNETCLFPEKSVDMEDKDVIYYYSTKPWRGVRAA